MFLKKIGRPFSSKEKEGDRDSEFQYEMGRGTYGKPIVHSWGEGGTLKIGAFCSIAEGVQVFLGGEHRTDWVTTYPFNVVWESAKHIMGHPKSKGDVIIGNDVWIGLEAVIMSGVTIGDGVVIGARSVVSKSIPPYAIAAGDPARIVKYRFNEETIRRLLEVRWWQWDDKKIERAIPLLLSCDIDRFLDAAENGRI